MSETTWGENFDHYNEQHTSKGAPKKGYIVGVNYKTHRVDVQLPLHGNIIIPDVRMGVDWHNGSGTGPVNLPPLNAEVEISVQEGKSAGFTSGVVTKVLYSGDWKPPSHPSMAGQKGFYARQAAVADGDHVTPGTLEMLDEHGGKHDLVMGKRVQRSRGQTDSRDDGLSITHAETQMMEGTNLAALADLKASTLDPAGDLNQLSRALGSVSETLGKANRATSAAAESFGDQVVTHAESLAIGNNAAALAAGGALPDSLI